MRRMLVVGIMALLLSGCSDAPTAPTPPMSLAITTQERFVLTGDTVQITISTEGGSASAVEWESLDPQVASVQDGVVTGIERGRARIVARAGSLADTAAVGVLRSSFNVSAADFCENPQFAPVRIAAVGERSIILADSRNPPGAFTDTEYRGFAAQFDDAIHPTITRAFGEPLDVGANARFLILFTRAVNELTPDPRDGFVAGFVWARDLFPRTPRTLLGLSFPDACPGSNEAEITYLAIPDPAWPEGIRNSIRRTTAATIAHELQHAINASRRIFLHNTLPEEVWLNEAMSHVAEELMFYQASGLSPGQSIDLAALTASRARVEAVNGFQVGNLVNFGRYLEEPEAESSLAPNAEATGEVRGAAWNLLRYAADRRGGNQLQFWNDLLNSSLSGTSNLQRAIGAELLDWMRDWAVSLYASGGIPDPAPRFRQASWDLRSVLPPLVEEFPLMAQPLQDKLRTSTTIRAGSAAYLRFAVAPDQVAEITVSVPGERPAESCRDADVVQSLGPGDVYTAPAGRAASVCFAGGASGTEHLLIPFHASLTPGANLIVEVVAHGIDEPAPQPSIRRDGAGRARGFDRAAGAKRPHPRHLWMREREREELAARLPGNGRDLLVLSLPAATSGPLMVSVIRIR
jgi:hypothetical protein